MVVKGRNVIPVIKMVVKMENNSSIIGLCLYETGC
jgi:hypothetical protein